MDLLTEGQAQGVAGLTGDAGEDKGVRSGFRRGSQDQFDQQPGAFAGAHFQDAGGNDVEDAGGGGGANGDADIAGLDAHPGAGAAGSRGTRQPEARTRDLDAQEFVLRVISEHLAVEEAAGLIVAGQGQVEARQDVPGPARRLDPAVREDKDVIRQSRHFVGRRAG